MEIRDWWSTEPRETFWMEITDRADLGADLFAPTTDAAGRPYWGYELVTHVQPGDTILHWHKHLLNEPGIVGYSRASGTYEDSTIEWRAHGTAGRTSAPVGKRLAWRMPLMDYLPLEAPVLMTQVRAAEGPLRAILAEMEKKHSGTLYFPFAFSDRREIRAQQTYLVKMPRAVLEALNLEDQLRSLDTRPARLCARPSHRGSGYLTDSYLRSAIEWHAVTAAAAAYEMEGFIVNYTGTAHPYDLEVTRGMETRRVEIKGSTGDAATVELTTGEVDHSRTFSPTDLYLVDRIEWKRLANGNISTAGGRVRWWRDWTPDNAHLRPTRHRYTLPD